MQVSGEGLGGVRVDVLEDGVFLTSSATTDELGRYALDVPPGRYDLRARYSGRYVSAFARDVDLDGKEPHTQDFELLEVETALRTIGIELAHREDTDRDAVPDVLERATRLDEKQRDSSEDGVAETKRLFLPDVPEIAHIGDSSNLFKLLFFVFQF